MVNGNGLRDLELRHLTALRAVAQEGSFGRAAERLGFTQSAVSQQIASLERVVGLPVFDRPGGPRPVELTQAGEVLLEHADAIARRLAAAAEGLERLRSGTGGRIVVGTFQSVSVKLLPVVIGRLRAELPDLEIQLYESDDRDQLTEQLLDGELDLTFTLEPEPDDRLVIVELWEDDYVAVSPRTEPASGECASFEDLASHPLIGQPEGSACQVLIDRAMHMEGLEPSYVFRSNDNGAVQALVRAGMGRAILPYLAIDADDPDVVVQALDPPLSRRISIALRAGRTLAPAAARLIEIAVDVCADFERPSTERDLGVLRPAVR